MTKSNGIKSLKQAAKLLNKHSPDGESLAYINPEEAGILKLLGGSGTPVNSSGVPSYFWDELWTGVKKVGSNILGRYTDKEYGGENVIKDLASLGGGYLGWQESKELSDFQKKQYEKQLAEEALNEMWVAQQTDEGKQLLAPQNVPETIEDVSVFKEATGIPDMKTAAHGGRIGYAGGADYYANLYSKYAQEMIQAGNTPMSIEDFVAIMKEQEGRAQGGRIGYNLGGIDRPFQGIGALNPRMGYQNAGEVSESITFGDADTANMLPLEEAAFNRPFKEWEKDAFAETSEMVENMKFKKLKEKWGDYQNVVGNNIYAMLELARKKGDTEFIEYLSPFTQEGSPFVEDPGFSTASGALGAAYGGRIGAQSGGIMPLLNMGGMEKDYRQDGGFVPIGRKEKADDVPARLSKNEFVFTADAVRAAGGGDIDQGAQRMYNVMKNLEAGGEISEQSQGQG